MLEGAVVIVLTIFGSILLTEIALSSRRNSKNYSLSKIIDVIRIWKYWLFVLYRITP